MYCFLRVAGQLGGKYMARNRKPVEAIAYIRTSSATNVGQDKDSGKRQRAAINAFAKANGYVIVGEFYDEAIRGSDPVAERPGFAAMLERIAGNGVRTVLVESPDRFARDLIVQLTGHAFLRKFGIALIPTTAPDYFTQDTPTGVLVRQVLGAVAEFQKAELVAKLKAARDRRIEAGEKCGGRHSYAERNPELVKLAKELSGHREPGSVRHPSLRWISAQLAEQGFVTPSGRNYSASAVASMLGG
jgi:DNA invertase Pin-like site-specific DNA recombinase